MDRKILQDVIENKTPRASGFLSKERREERRPKVLDQTALQMKVPSYGSWRPSKAHMVIFGVVIIAMIFFLLGNFTATAKVTVMPRTETVEVDTNIKAYKLPETPLLLGFKTYTATSSKSLDVPASGTKYVERKASGKIIVYNEYSKEPIKIIPNTRFKSSAGKIFRSYNAFFIPGFKDSGGVLKPGQIEVAVVADSSGADFNITLDSFTLPGLSGSAMAEKVYAKSLSAMTGGFKGETSVVSDKDLTDARSHLEGALTEKLLEAIGALKDSDDVIFNDAYSMAFFFNEYGEGDENTEGKNQRVTLSGTVSAIAFSKKGLAQMLARRELTGVGDESLAISNWEDLEGELNTYEQLEAASELSLRVSGTAKFVWQFDKESLAASLAGTPKETYSQIFLNYPAIDRAEVSSRPFWSRTFPKDPDRIKIVEQIE